MPLPKLTKDPSLKALGINPGKFKSEIKLQAATIVASKGCQSTTSTPPVALAGINSIITIDRELVQTQNLLPIPTGF